MATATKNRDKSSAEVVEQNGAVAQADEYRRKVSHELSEAYRVLGRAQVRLDRCKSEQKAAKGDVESAQQEVNDLVSELRDIELGQYQPDLFEKNGNPTEADGTGVSSAGLNDEGADKPIESLSEFGLTAKKCEALRESKFEIKTVGDLERTIRENEWWHRDIKGFGETTIDKLTEALTEFRLTYPVPVPADDVHESNDGDLDIDEDDDVGAGDGLGDV